MTVLRTALAGDAGRDKATLEALRDELEPSAERLGEVIDLAHHADAGVAAGATWLLRAWVEGGAVLGPVQVDELAAMLLHIRGPWARQHVCQTVRSLTVPVASAPAFATFLIACCGSDRPFLRAWAVDGLFHLALSHRGYASAARLALLAAGEDPAASVRARARHLDGAKLG